MCIGKCLRRKERGKQLLKRWVAECEWVWKDIKDEGEIVMRRIRIKLYTGMLVVWVHVQVLY